ncbi:MAG TPA: bifunctional adenosylcobinamide kinase/adenosylcobinamide-phosphate guanylyltransferase [Ruminiclostridium sp.]|nr:bifunctional adenosylcobinamide kinase/adenosylcobinamide-phosphate guanylyltransferase [Ruminiclostridium sp.]
MGRIILVTGGARSGKSTFAEELYSKERDVVYIATARISDEEMRDRVSLHRAQRPEEWMTYEGNYDLKDAVGTAKNYLLDCITVLTSNIMFDLTGELDAISLKKQREVEDRVVSEIYELAEAVKKIEGNLVMVTNEVGYSIVPENNIARIFRDVAGRVNQRTAELCTEVYLVACGIPLRLK